MDLPTITDIQRPADPNEIAGWKPGAAWLAGGTWLFSEPQPSLDTLIDIETFGWPAIEIDEAGIRIAATCRVIELDRVPVREEWPAMQLFRQCCRSFLASFKIWNEATVGGNIVMSLPAGPMISLTVALEGICELWPREGDKRELPMAEFVTGLHANQLQPGELLRAIHLPAAALRKRHAFRRFSLTHLGRSEALLIGTRCPDTGRILLTVTAATIRPVQIAFESVPDDHTLATAIDAAIPDDLYLDDVHGSPPHRKHLTHRFAHQIITELQQPPQA